MCESSYILDYQYESIFSVHFRPYPFYLSINLFLLLCELFPQVLTSVNVEIRYGSLEDIIDVDKKKSGV